jgi:hypothetical protein
VVRDQVLGFPEPLGNLADPPVASRQLAEKLPAQRVRDQLQEVEGCLFGSRGDHT